VELELDSYSRVKSARSAKLLREYILGAISATNDAVQII